MNRFNSRGRKQGHQSSSNTDTCEVLVVDIGKPLDVPAEEHGHGDRNNVVVLPTFFLLCWKAFVASSNGMGTYHVFHWDISCVSVLLKCVIHSLIPDQSKLLSMILLVPLSPAKLIPELRPSLLEDVAPSLYNSSMDQLQKTLPKAVLPHVHDGLFIKKRHVPHPNLLKKLTSQRLRIWAEHFLHCKGVCTISRHQFGKNQFASNRRGQETVWTFFWSFFLHHFFGFIYLTLHADTTASSGRVSQRCWS